MKIIIVNFISTIMLISSFAQDSTIILDERTYIYLNNDWYVIDQATNENFKVDVKSITVKLIETIPTHALTNYCNNRAIIIERVNELGYYDLRLPINSVFHVSYNHLKNLGFFESIHINTFAKPSGPENEPDDPGFFDQYYLWPYYELWPQINAVDAWLTEDGSTNPVIVGVIGLGVDQNHGDINYSENRGWDYYSSDPNPAPHPGDHHETKVAGIIAAKTNNNTAVAGVAGGWGPSNYGAQVMALKVAEGGDWRSSVVDDAIIYAANNGAKVINMSFWDYDSPALQDAVKYARNNKGCILVSTTGHFGGSGIPFPARYPEVLAVQGIDKNWVRLGRYSNSNDDIDVTAPGEDIHSLFNNNGFGNAGYGTSFAAPMVSGVSALLLSNNPNLAPMDIKNILKSSSMYEIYLEPDPGQFGSGLLKANRAISCLFNANGIIPDYPTQLTLIDNNPITIRWRTVQPTLESSFVSHYNIYRSKSPNRYNFNKVGDVAHNDGYQYTYWTEQDYLSGGTYYYRVTTADSDGKESITSNEISITTGIEQKIGSGNQNELVFDYNLEQNYPNPFNPSTTISYSIKDNGLVSLVVYDILGRQITTLINELKEPGNYSILFNASSLPSGFYIYRLKINDFVSSKKFIIIK